MVTKKGYLGVAGVAKVMGRDKIEVQFSSVQSLSCVRLFATPWIVAHQASLSITNSRSSLRPTSIKSVMPSSHFILCRPLLLLPPIPPSIKVFSNESTLRMRLEGGIYRNLVCGMSSALFYFVFHMEKGIFRFVKVCCYSILTELESRESGNDVLSDLSPSLSLFREPD